MDRGLMTVIGSYQVWPEGLTWCFFGTVAEDGTGGTHICSLTVTPGVGNEMQVMLGRIVVGNSATAQSVFVNVTDGTNTLFQMFNVSGTTASLAYAWPLATTANTGIGMVPTNTGQAFIISGTMQLILQVSTAAISITQTFSLVCRIKGSAPTAVLSDTVGTPVLTTTTNKVFG